MEDQLLKEIKAGKYRECYLVYIRKSTDEPNNQKNSIPYQKAEGVKFAKNERLPIAPISINGFCRDGLISEKHSGFKDGNDLAFTKDGMVQYRIERPKFQRLLQFLNLGLFKGVICLCWDRISRNRGDDTVIRKLMRKGVDVRFVYAKYDDTSAGELHMDIDGMFAEHHSRVTSEKVRLATRELRDRGIVTSKAPIGYLNQGTMEHKPFDPERAPVIKKLFELYATGDWSLSDLVGFANNQGLTTPPTRRRRTQDEMLAEEEDEIKIEKVSRPIILSHLHKMLTNPFYTGRTHNSENQFVPSASHEPLVSDELFQKVQMMLGKKRVSVHYTEKLQYPYRGLVRCAACGRVYTPYVKKGIYYYGSRCAADCGNPRKSFNSSYFEAEISRLMARLSFTEQELVRLDASTSTDIALFEEKRLQDIEVMDRKKRKIREDLTYLRSNKLQLLKSGVYTPELLLDEERKLNSELETLQETEAVSDLSMKATMEDIVKLSELLKIGFEYYSAGKSREKEEIIRILFSELSISGNTLHYQCRNGFRALESRFIPECGQTTWISEAMQLTSHIRESIQSLSLLLSTDSPAQPPGWRN